MRIDYLSHLQIFHAISLRNKQALHLSNPASDIFHNISQRKRLFIIPMLHRLIPSSSNFSLPTYSLYFSSIFISDSSFVSVLANEIHQTSNWTFLREILSVVIKTRNRKCWKEGCAIRKFNSSLSTAVTLPDS